MLVNGNSNIIRIVYVTNAHKIIICSIAKVNVKQKVMRVEEPQMAPRHQVIHIIPMERALQLWRHLQILVDCYDDIDGGDFMRQCADFVGL